MDNKTISRTFRLLSQLMELHGENTFKIKTIASAAFTIDKLPVVLSSHNPAEIDKIPGIGKGMAQKIGELLSTGTLAELTALLDITPAPILEIMSIKGLGPKKVLVIWKELGIENIGELYYACNENRLIEAKGFGLKTQDEIRRAIEFKMAGKGRFLWVQAEGLAKDVFAAIENFLPNTLISFCGAYRRKCEIVDSVDILIADLSALDKIHTAGLLSSMQITLQEDTRMIFEHPAGLRFILQTCEHSHWGNALVKYTGSDAHLDLLSKRLNIDGQLYGDEESLYGDAGISFVEPELREGLFEFNLLQNGAVKLIEFGDLRGSLHNHSTWSDGLNSLKEMAMYCKEQLGMQYLGICDHSRSAFYAKGLTEDRVIAQHAEIDLLNRDFDDFKIFKGIESDILFDGSLDYSDEILSSFDFIVASVHSVFRMTEEKATARLIAAIENPYTTILGHPTGRLLLAREGYPVDIKKVIDACAANGVVIEINANPLRLDIDWRWHQYAIEKGVMLSINPDAHSTRGLLDMHYGVMAARKGGLTKENCLNTQSLKDIERVFTNRRAAII